MGWEVGGSFSREGIYVYLWYIHFDVWQRPAQHCKAISSKRKKHTRHTQVLISSTAEKVISTKHSQEV